MATRNRRTLEQIANDLEARALVARTKAKKMEKAKHTRTAIIAGESIRAMADNGDAEAKSVWGKMLDGLKRKQDRLAFGLEPLPEPEPDDQPDANPPAADPLVATVDPMPAAVARHHQAINAWHADSSERNRVGVGEAIAAIEKLTGEFMKDPPFPQRVGWGLGDRPGELVSAS
jgi:hypothetical protein